MHRPRAVTFAVFLLLQPFAAPALADTPYPVFVDGVRFDKRVGSVVEREGSRLIEAVCAVRIFDGLLGFAGNGKIVRVTIDRRTMNFVIGQKTAYLDGMKIALPVAPQRIAGDVYLPLVTMAKFGSARVVIDRERHIASFRTGGGDSFALPQAPARKAEIGDDEPSLAQALSIQTSATVDARGLHAVANIRNTTSAAYKIVFPSQRQFAFVLYRDGKEVWRSTVGATGTAPSSLVIGALENTTVDATDPEFDRLGPGRYLLRLRVETLDAFELPPISLGDVAPAGPSSTH